MNVGLAGKVSSILKPATGSETPLAVDELWPYLEEIEQRILALADVQFDSASEPSKLRVVV